MVSEQESPRALLTPGEVLQFPASEALVMVGGSPPYRGLKVRYYEDKRFMNRAKLPRPDAAELQQQELNGLGLASAWLHLPTPTVGLGQTSGVNGNGTPSGVSGGVLLEGEIQHNPEWGISVDDRQQPAKPKPQLELDDNHQDAEKHKMRELEQQRTERNRQLGRQRAIEQSRQPSGGGMPL